MALTLLTNAAPFFSLTTPGSVPTGRQTEITNALQSLMDLIPSPTTGIAVTYAPDFDQIPPAAAKKLTDQLTVLKAAFAAIKTLAVPA